MKPYRTLILSYYQADEDVGSVRPKSWHKYLAEYEIHSHIIYGTTLQSNGKADSVRGRSSFVKSLLKNIRNIFSLKSCFLEPQNLKLVVMLRAAVKYMSINKNENIVLVSSYGPFVTILVGFIIKIMYPKVVWHVDYRDDWTSNYKKKGVLNFIDMKIEKFFSKYYDIVTTVSEGYAKRISKSVPGNIYVIPNGFDESEYTHIAVSPKVRDNVTFAYTGTLNAWRRGVKNFIDAFSDTHQKAHAFEFFIAGDIGSELTGDNINGIKALGLIDRKSAIALQKKSDYLVFFDTGVEGELSSKIFEYLGAKRPIIIVGNGTVSGVRSLVEPTGLYIGVDDDYDSIKSLLKDLKPKIQPQIAESELQKYTRKSQVLYLMNLYNAVLRNCKN